MGSLRRILETVAGTVIGGLVLWLFTLHFDSIANWLTNKIWQIAAIIVGCVIGAIMGWKINQIWCFLKWISKKNWRFICALFKWFKNIFTINMIEEKFNKELTYLKKYFDDKILCLETDLKEARGQIANLDKEIDTMFEIKIEEEEEKVKILKDKCEKFEKETEMIKNETKNIIKEMYKKGISQHWRK